MDILSIGLIAIGGAFGAVFWKLNLIIEKQNLIISALFPKEW
jgi:hypothetical protein